MKQLEISRPKIPYSCKLLQLLSKETPQSGLWIHLPALVSTRCVRREPRAPPLLEVPVSVLESVSGCRRESEAVPALEVKTEDTCRVSAGTQVGGGRAQVCRAPAVGDSPADACRLAHPVSLDTQDGACEALLAPLHPAGPVRPAHCTESHRRTFQLPQGTLGVETGARRWPKSRVKTDPTHRDERGGLNV